MPSLQIKRIYAPAAKTDGQRILVDRLWPRGVSKAKAKLDEWYKDTAPSDALRKWYGHDPAKWPEFKKRYLGELRANKEAVQRLLTMAKRKNTTLLFGAKDEERNEAVVLRDFLQAHIK